MTTIEFRDVQEEDIPDLIALNKYFGRRFLADDESIDEATFTLEQMQDCFTLVFTVPSEGGRFPIGSVSFTDKNQDLSAILHFIMRPAYLTRFLKEKTFLDALLDRFRAVKVAKFTITTPDFNKSAQRLATKIGFQYVASFKNELYYLSKPRDVHFYSLTRKDLAKELAKQLIAEETEYQDVQLPKIAELPKKRRRRKQ